MATAGGPETRLADLDARGNPGHPLFALPWPVPWDQLQASSPLPLLNPLAHCFTASSWIYTRFNRVYPARRPRGTRRQGGSIDASILLGEGGRVVKIA